MHCRWCVVFVASLVPLAACYDKPGAVDGGGTESDTEPTGGSSDTDMTMTSSPSTSSASTTDSTTDGSTSTGQPGCSGVDGQPDADCTDPDAPYCLGGNCVGCDALDADGCAAISETAPICDSRSGVCAACSEHDQCETGACEIATGACFPATSQLWVDAAAGNCGAADGSELMPFCDLVTAVDLVTGQVGSEPWTIFVAGNPADYVGRVYVSGGKTLAIIGPAVGLEVAITNMTQETVRITQGATVYLDDVVVRNNSGETAVECGTGLLWMTDSATGGPSEINAGVDIYDCEAHIVRTTMSQSSKGVSVAVSGTLFMDESTVSGNQGAMTVFGEATIRRSTINDSWTAGGILIDGGHVRIENSIVHDNIYAFGGIMAQGGGSFDVLYSTFADSIDCNGAGASTIRNSIVFPVGCPLATIDNSAVDFGVGQGMGNVMWEPEDAAIFVNGYHVMPGAMPVADLAVHQSGDPEVDFDGDPRPADDGASGYAGADHPQ